jgi:hypothetical protein
MSLAVPFYSITTTSSVRIRVDHKMLKIPITVVRSRVSMKHPEKVFRPLESELRASAPFYFSLLRSLNREPYEENGKLCLEVPGDSIAARYLTCEKFRAYLKDFSRRNGDEVFVKVTH